MSDGRPRLLLITDSPGDSPAREALAANYDVTAVTPEDAPAALEAGGYDFVLSAPADANAVHGRVVSEQARTLLNSIGEGACLCDADGRVRWSNDMYRSFSKSLHARVEELAVQAASHFTALLRRHGRLQRGHGKRFTVAIREEQRFFELLISPVISDRAMEITREDDDARITRVAVVARESTARRQMQQKIDAIVKAGRELVHIDADTVKSMHAADRLKLLEDKVIRYAHEILKFDHFAVRLVNKKTNCLELVMAYGLPESAKEIQLFADPENNGISGFVAATGWSYICPDAGKDKRYVFGLDQSGSSLTVPVKLFDEVIGVFNVESANLNAFTEADRQFAEIFAHSLAMAFHILNLLLVERTTTKELATDTVKGELEGPLEDLVAEAEILLQEAGDNSDSTLHLRRILRDVEAIRRRVKNIARGPQTLLGVDQAIEEATVDPTLKDRHVLIIDNEEKMLELIDNLLTRSGCHVERADSGEAGLERLNAAVAGALPLGRFDLVVSDINLGDSTGYDVFAAARRTHGDIPVILMTGFGYDPHHSIVRASQEGLQSVLFKPFKADKLIEEAKRALGETIPESS